jgi:hypothetical protein
MLDPSNQLKCVQCSLGLVPSGDGFSCVLNCPSGCLNCTDAICSLCKAGYSLILGNCTLDNCSSSNCLLCDSNQSCLQCDSYSTLTNGVCRLTCSIPSCSLCKSNSNECEICASGFTVNSWSNRCIITPIANCLKVLDYSQQEYICMECSNNLIPTTDQLACFPNCTIANCNSCNSSGCSSCRIGYQLTSSKACSLNYCPLSNCLFCDGVQKCLKCSSNHTLSGGQCIMAQCLLTNCKSCKIGSSLCDACSIGFALNVWLGSC